MLERGAVWVVVACGLAACAAPQAPSASNAKQAASPSAAQAASSSAAQVASSSATRVATPALPGRWVEFWALSGAADTQCYAFFDDGRFGWHAAAAGHEPESRRWGRYRVDGGALVLSVEGHEQRSGCQGAACRVTNPQPHKEQLPLGDCPPNEEAKNLDPAYLCVSIAGHAFWRDTHAAPDPAAYIP